MIVSKDTGSVRPMEFVEQAQEVTWNPPSPLSPSHVGHETDAERIARLMREDGVEETVISERVGRVEDGDNTLLPALCTRTIPSQKNSRSYFSN